MNLNESESWQAKPMKIFDVSSSEGFVVGFWNFIYTDDDGSRFTTGDWKALLQQRSLVGRKDSGSRLASSD
jgi:hypothetical protein